MRRKRRRGLENINFDYGKGEWDIKDKYFPKSNHSQRQPYPKAISKRKPLVGGVAVSIVIVLMFIKFALDQNSADITEYLNKVFSVQNQAYNSLNQVQTNYTLHDTNTYLQDINQKSTFLQQNLLKELATLKVPKGFEKYHQLATQTLLDISLIMNQYMLNKQSGINNPQSINQQISNLNNTKTILNQELIHVFDTNHISYTLRPDGTISSYSVER